MSIAIAEKTETIATSPDNARETARSILAQHSHFHGRVDNFEFVVVDCILVVRGCVPSFYLKQVLQTLLQDMAGIRRIDNRVDVISVEGLSSLCDDDR
jgi:hypothetical protein